MVGAACSRLSVPNLPFIAPWAGVLVATLACSLLVTAWVLLAIFGVLSASPPFALSQWAPPLARFLG